MNILRNQDLSVKYLNTLNHLNQQSTNPGTFDHFTAAADATRTQGFKQNTFANNPISFYKNINLHNHNWMTLNTVIQHGRHRHDMDVNNLLANYLDIDCLQNGVKPQDFVDKYRQYEQHHHKHQLPKPTALLSSGHGVYLIYFYKHPIELGDKPTQAKRHELDKWRTNERSLAKYMNIQTKKWFRKGLADPHSTNPSRILRMPNTVNVKYLNSDNNFTKPALCFIKTYSGKQYDPQKFNQYIHQNYTPLFNENVRQSGRVINPLNIDHQNAFWQKALTAKDKINHNDKHKTFSSKLYQNRYQYGSYRPYRKRKPYQKYNFTALDYLSDHHIKWNYMSDGKNIYIPDQEGLVHNGGDLSSVRITQTMNHSRDPKTGEYTQADPKHSFTQINRMSGKWDGVMDEGLNDLTKIVMLHHDVFNKKEANKIADQWKKHYAAEGHTKTAFPWQKYGTVGNQQVVDSGFKGRLLRKVEKESHQSLDDLNVKGTKKASKYVSSHMIDNNIARNYLIHQRGLSKKTVNRLINRGLVRGIKGYVTPQSKILDAFKKYHQAKSSAKQQGEVTNNGVKKASNNLNNVLALNKFGAPMVEFIQRKPRSAEEAHTNQYHDYNATQTLADDIKLRNKKYIPKYGKQKEIACGADYIGVTPTNKTYTDKTGKTHHIYDTQMVPNRSGELSKNKLVDSHGDRNYGFNFKIGNGTKNLYLYEDPIDAISHHELQQKHLDVLKRTQPNNKHAIKQATDAIHNSTYLSLSGSGSKVSSVQQFINNQYPMGNEYRNIICGFDNDSAGYEAAQKLASEFGDRVKYAHSNNPQQVKLSTVVPISNNRQAGQLTSRFDANQQHSSFNKDWNDMVQSATFKHHQFKQPDVKMNISQYSNQNIQQMYTDMASSDKKNHLKIGIKSDFSKADLAIKLMDKVHQNYQQGFEAIDSKNPRIRAITKTEKSMTKPAQHIFKNYMGEIGVYIPINNISQYSTNALKHFHISNQFLYNKRTQQVMNQPHNISKLHRDINKTFNQIQHPQAKKLLATAIQANSQIEARKAYHYYHGTPYGRKQYYKLNHQKPYPEYTSNKQTAQIQNKIDTLQKQKSFKKLQQDYPKDFAKVKDVGQDIQQLELKEINPTNNNARKDLVQSQQYVMNDLHKSKILDTYKPKDLIQKSELSKYEKDIDTVNKSTNSQIKQRKQQREKTQQFFKKLPKAEKLNYASVVNDAYMEQYRPRSQRYYKSQAYKHYHSLAPQHQNQVVHHLQKLTPYQLKREAWNAHQYIKKSTHSVKKSLASIPVHHSDKHYSLTEQPRYHQQNHHYNTHRKMNYKYNSSMLKHKGFQR